MPSILTTYSDQNPMRVLRKEDWFHEDGFPIVVERRDPQTPFGIHSHEFSELVLITGGRGMHVTDEDEYELVAGDVFVIGPTRPHDYLNMDRLSLINILFDEQLLPMSIADMNSLAGYHAMFKLEPAHRKRDQFMSRLQLSPSQLAHALRCIDLIESECANREVGFGVMAATQFLQLVAFLSRCYGKADGANRLMLLQIAETVAYLEGHYSEPISLEDLVQISRMSRRHFLRAFEASMGHPPIQYLIQLRIRHACRLLRQTEQSITQIALGVGFSDSNYFARQFRNLMNTSPRDWRRQVG